MKLDLATKYKPGTNIRNLRSEATAIVDSLDIKTDTCNLKIAGLEEIVDYSLSLMDMLWTPSIRVK